MMDDVGGEGGMGSELSRSSLSVGCENHGWVRDTGVLNTGTGAHLGQRQMSNLQHVYDQDTIHVQGWNQALRPFAGLRADTMGVGTESHGSRLGTVSRHLSSSWQA